MTTTATRTARPASDFDPLMLMEAVEEVARIARPVDPERVAQRPWDAARTLSARFADAPPARRIAEHLGLKWSEVVRISLLAPAARRISLGHQFGGASEDWLTPEYLVFALRLVAARLGVATLDPGRYRSESQRMLAADRARKHGGQLRLPSDDQVRRAAGSWARALQLAGLAPRPRGSAAARRPPSIIEVLDRCYEHYGVEPHLGGVVTFARANGIPFPRKERGKPWSAYVAEWKAARRANGQPVPDGPPPKGAVRPDYNVDVGAALPGEGRQRDWSDFDECVTYVRAYLDQLAAGERASQRGYDDWRRTQPEGPWTAVFGQRHGGRSVVLDAARQRTPA